MSTVPEKTANGSALEPVYTDSKGRDLMVSLQMRGMTPQQFRVLKNTIWPAAKTTEAVLMAIDYCKARHLDPFKRQCHIVPVWDNERKCYVDTIWPGIAELRTTAARTGAYAGRDSVEYGPAKQMDLGEAKDFSFPEWAKVTVYRLVGGQRVAFHGDPVFFLEAYAKKKKTDPTPNEMWSKRPWGQLAKVAEAAALRAAFPEELGGEYAAEEMEGQAMREAPTIERVEETPKPASRTEALKARLIPKSAATAPEPSGTPEGNGRPEEADLLAECEAAIGEATSEELADVAADITREVADVAIRERLFAALEQKRREMGRQS